MKINESQQAKFGPYMIKWTGDQLMFYVNGKLQKAIDVDANSFGMNDFKKTVKKIAMMKKMEDELPFSIMAEGQEINEKVDHIDDEEADTDYEDLEDKDIDNDGDEDESDKYLHHKLGTTAKKTENIKLKGMLKKEAAPKMKVYSWEKNYKEALRQFDISASIMKTKSSGGHAKVKKQIDKTRKALVALWSQMKINSTEF